MKKSRNWPRDPLARLAALTVLIVGLAGCAGPRTDLAPRTSEGPAMDLARGLYLRNENFMTLAARGAVTHVSGSRRAFFRFEALVMKPDRLLLTVFDPAGRPAFRLASAEGRLTGLIYGAREYFTGPATAENFARLLPLNLTQDQLLALLCGSTGRPAAAGAREKGEDTELVIVPAEAPDNENEVWRLRLAGSLDQDPRRAVILSATRGPAGRPNLNLRYLVVQVLPRTDKPDVLIPFPTSVEAEWPKAKQFLRLTYDEVSLGAELDSNLFILTPPEGFKMVTLP